MEGTTIAVTADNLACELIYRLYKNLLNQRYNVDCEEYDLDEISSAYYMYNSGCEFTEDMECIKPILLQRNWNCDSLINIQCFERIIKSVSNQKTYHFITDLVPVRLFGLCLTVTTF